jgi:hypothetical protein
MRNIESNYGNEENASKSSARILKEVFDSFLSKEVFNNIEIVHFKYEDSSGEGILILKLSEKSDLNSITNYLEKNKELGDKFEWDFSTQNNQKRIEIKFKSIN